MRPVRPCAVLLGLVLVGLPTVAALADDRPAPLNVLFLGDDGHHQPALRYAQLRPVFRARGIELEYADSAEALSADNLARFDALLIYANITEIAPRQEQALLDYVASGKGFVPVHCASFCFLNSPKYVELVGAQFQRHETGIVRSTVAQPDHPVMRGYQGFASWDETYVHHRHNERDRVVLEYREANEQREPWTWVRTHGKGRVFYTAWGHDDRTWGNPGFHNLLERGLRWAAGQDPAAVPDFADRPRMTPRPADLKPFEYAEASIPFYPAGRQWGTLAEPIRQMQRPVPPAESARHMVVPEGFSVELFAAEPQIGKPLCMNWDERGRLWLAETIDYPNELAPEGRGRDRIRICEDTDGDGLADRFTIFAENLSIPTSLAFANGGVVVHQAPHTLFLKDTDGDDRADERRVLLAGWGTSDTHAGPSNLRYGHDNWLYGIVGYSGFEGVVGGQKHSFRMGFYRFRPDGSRLEFLRNTSNNSWGVGFSEEGLLFGSTANGEPSVFMPMANRHYESVRGWSSTVLRGIAESNRFEPITENVRQVDFHGGFTAAAGHALYTARDYPREYWNRTAFVCEPTGHLVATFALQPAGAGFRSRNAFNLLASDDEWTAPIMAEVGPDGNVWVIDWYNFIVQHNPTPTGFKTGKGNAYETNLRDKQHGRVYRIVYGKASRQPAGGPQAFSLAGAPVDRLIDALSHPNMFWRLHAQRLLVERHDRDVVPRLLPLVRRAAVDELGLNPGALHALWVLHGLGALDDTAGQEGALEVVEAAMRHPSAAVRRAALLVAPRSAAWIGKIAAGGLLHDEAPQVRLAALLALAEGAPHAIAGEALAHLVADTVVAADPVLVDGLVAAAAAHARLFLAGVVRFAAGDARGGRAAADRPPPAQVPAAAGRVLSIVAEHDARGGLPDNLESIIEPLDRAPAWVADPVLAGLERGWPRNAPPLSSAAVEGALVRLAQRDQPLESRGRVVRLAQKLGSTQVAGYAAQLAEELLERVNSAELPEAVRGSAAAQFVAFVGTRPDMMARLLERTWSKTSPELARGILEAAGKSDAVETGGLLIDLMESMPPAANAEALRVLLSRVDWTRALLDALESGKLVSVELSLEQQQALAAHPDRAIARRGRALAERKGGLPNADRQAVLEGLLSAARATGDVARGKEVFKKHCAKCHVHGDEGTRIGPDLTGMAVHPKDELLTQIIDPSRSVEGNFRIYSVIMSDGRTLSGLLASESRTAIELIDAEAKKQTLLREEIEELVASPKSLMPDGFEKQLSPADFTDLLEFLTQRGKYLPIDLRKVATVVSTRGMFYSEESEVERLVFADWSPKVVAGVPFQLVDPQGDRVRNVVLLHGPQGAIPPRMPRSVKVACNAPARAIHLLGAVSGWGFPLGERGSVSLIVRLHYADGQTEDHPLKNGEHLADYIRRVEVPESRFAFNLRGRQVRYLSIVPRRSDVIAGIELVKGQDATAPVVVALTLEAPGPQ